MKNKIYYLIGQPGAGKTTLGKYLCEHILENVEHIDGDHLRKITSNKDFGEEGRRRNIRMGQNMAILYHNEGKNVVLSMVSPFKDLRDYLKNVLKDDVVEIFVHTSDIRGRENFHVTDFQMPNNNFIDVDTTNATVSQSIAKIISNL